ncbi:FAD-dependent oxidoreductase [Chitinophaga filiformis]|uniref:flavin monoamine oxidase family protein n=1 Tax=Chitinophaga filiformis TaxID=104663 RepID=UPI001F201F23|nr:NAD(P)/FAD-dependent oxidoreductase [Chitinophaga filiformis]MCF6406347.1 FAD-dependent oxidoreductase [Chitinophaga filiformis]
MAKTSEEIIIIGAGAAGLIAARELAGQYKITILEAMNTTGGRIKTIYRDGIKIAETGAEFVHGELPITIGLLKEAGLQYQAISGQMFHVRDGQWMLQHEMISNWDQLLEQMGKSPADMTMQDFLDQHYPYAQHPDLRQNIQGFVQGFDLADISKVSVQYLYDEWTNESEKNFRIDRGYSAMTDFLEEECRKLECNVITNTTVTAVEWSAGKVQVQTANGTTFSADKLIVTIPLGALQKNTISFSPAIPDYIKAANDIGWGIVIKTILHFKTPFWEKHSPQMGFLFGETPIPTWWTQNPSRTNTLTGWLGGPPSAAHITQTDEQLLDLSISSLASLCNETEATLREQLVSAYIANWTADPHVMGGYSYGTPASQAAQALLNTGIENTIYFAGEALYNGASPGTVEAALTTGKSVAKKIKGR